MVLPLLLLIALSILFVSHYFVYYSFVYFFGIVSPEGRLALAALFFLLPLSFIASAFLARWMDNLLSRVLYFSTGLWLGVGLTLMTAFAFTWASWGATRALTHSPKPAWFGSGAVVLAGLYSAYGVWNAYHPRSRHVTVKLKNLPAPWHARVIVQISDVHLGHILGARFLERLVAMANAENPAIVFITGDLFDGVDAHLEQLAGPLNGLHAPLGIYFVTGNHETYLGVERAYRALRSTPARILADEKVLVEGLQIIGVSYPERGRSKDLAKVIRQLSGFDPASPSVLLYHSPTHIAQAKAAGIGLQLSGHAHHGQVFPIQFISRLVYGRYYHGLHIDGDYTLYTSSGAGTWGPTLRTGNHPEIAVIHLEFSK